MSVKFLSTKWECMALAGRTHLPLETVFHTPLYHRRPVHTLILRLSSAYQCKNGIFLILNNLFDLDPLPQSCLAKTHLHNTKQLSSVEGHLNPGNAMWSSVPAALDVQKQHGTLGTLTMFLTLAVPPKGRASDAAWKDFMQLCSLTRLSPYLSLYSLTTAKHMPLQPQRPAIVILSVLSFSAGFSCLVWLAWHAAVCQPLGQSCSDHVTATPHTAPHSGKRKPSEERQCTDLFVTGCRVTFPQHTLIPAFKLTWKNIK